MKVQVVAVGRPGSLLRDAILEYEERASRYWPLDVAEVKAEKGSRGRSDAEIRTAESERLLARVEDGMDTVVLTREGKPWSSTRLARYLQELAVRGHPGVAFLIGGALGIDDATRRNARRRLSLSGMTMPHELARLVLAEQLYRAGTIARGEPYHKG